MISQFVLGSVSDNQDPDKLHRVRVSIRKGKEENSEWLPVVTSYAGEDAGLYFLPDIDDQVLVISLDEENKQKAVLGSIWDNNTPPPETGENTDADLNQDGKNALCFFKSRSGAMIIFDDTNESEKIQLISSDPETRLEFSAADELTVFSSGKDLALQAKKTLTFDAEKIEIKASKKLSYKSEGLQLKASKKLKMNADKQVSVKGSAIKLN